ncbi:ABC transporter permease subunit [uncultured Methanoculleus sp.]|uniref:ABC transporter permease subunit n=1 Tax=uncultured Methanoculleus sp. TaxID=183762 RepID=UPI003204F39E
MTVERVLIVAGKEFTDHLTSRKFLVILALLLMFALLGMHQGIDQYNQDLEAYNQQLQAAEDAADPAGKMPERPSILVFFRQLENSLMVFGGVLAIATGADLVSKERESRSLKSLLSHPVYRDEIINGKALGGMAALGVALVVAFALTFAVLLVFSIVPTADEVSAVLIFGLASFLFMLAFFALALALSVGVKESGHAVVYGLTLFFALSYLLQMFGAVLAGAVAGDIPERPEMPAWTDSAGVTHLSYDKAYEEEYDRYAAELEIYQSKRQLVADTVYLFSPLISYNTVASTVFYPSNLPPEDATDRIWRNFAALIVFPSVFFAAAYVKFMRMDIR